MNESGLSEAQMEEVLTRLERAQQDLHVARGILESEFVPWDKVIIDELATNPGPYTYKSLNKSGGWWKRKLEEINGVTIHHTLSHSPHATASYYVRKDGGRPTTPYTIWVTQTGEVLLCVSLSEGLWHDHTGHTNTHLSIGMAGRLHEVIPADVQLDAAVNVCAWAVTSNILPGIDKVGQVQGHRDWVRIYHDEDYYPDGKTPWTICPGWEHGLLERHWKDDFYGRLEAVL